MTMIPKFIGLSESDITSLLDDNALSLMEDLLHFKKMNIPQFDRCDDPERRVFEAWVIQMLSNLQMVVKLQNRELVQRPTVGNVGVLQMSARASKRRAAPTASRS